MADLRQLLAPGNPLPMGTVWMLTNIMESKGKQDLWLQRRPETLAVLSSSFASTPSGTAMGGYRGC